MNNIKAQYKAINALLEANKGKSLTVKLMAELTVLMSSKVVSKSHISDDNGNVVAVFCYYHKKWELVEHIEYGSKASTKSGLNTMCKVGVNQWTKQQKEFKSEQTQILADIVNGDLSSENAKVLLEEANEYKTRVIPIDDKFQEYSTDEAPIVMPTKKVTKKVTKKDPLVDDENDPHSNH